MEEGEKQVSSTKYDTDPCDECKSVAGLGEMKLLEEKKGEGAKMLRSWNDAERRSQLFDYCNVENPNEELTMRKGENVMKPGARARGIEVGATGSESVDGRIRATDHHESIVGWESHSNPFAFSQKPIEKIEILQKEVNLERQSAIDKQQQQQQLIRSLAHSFKTHPELQETVLEKVENDVVDEEDEKEDLNSPLQLFQKLSLFGDNSSGVPNHELMQASKLLCEALFIRSKYMALSLQYFCATTARCIQKANDDYCLEDYFEKYSPTETWYNKKRALCSYEDLDGCKADGSEWVPFNSETPTDTGYTIDIKDGIFKVTGSKRLVTGETSSNDESVVHPLPSIDEFIKDHNAMLAFATHGPVKSFAYRRLQFLESKFKLHLLLNEIKERATLKDIVHRDFYNVRKVDTHIHAASCMTQKHLLRFIKKRCKTYGDEIVDKVNGKEQTLNEAFQSLGLNAKELTVDKLDVHADKDTFHRFDEFNLKYNPVGQSKIREFFMKTDNYMQGQYFAQIIK